jgi:uncharacterized membrane protein YccC
MSGPVATVSASKRPRVRQPWRSPGAGGQRARLLPQWSVPAAMRAVRATIVIPGLFALTFKVVGNPQMALFATFGGFASLVFASFAGSRRDKAIAHLGLAVSGSIVLVIGTAVSSITWLAAIVTVPVAFTVFFAGVAGPNAASGVTATLLAYVLPVASSGYASMIPARLAGWWLASAAATAAVLLFSPRPPGDRLRASAASTAAALADQLQAAAGGSMTHEQAEASLSAKYQLMDVFAATPYRPTGLATADQGMANLVQILEWCASLTSDALGAHRDLRNAAAADRELLSVAAGVLEDVAWLLRGQDITTQDVTRDVDRLEGARAASAAYHSDPPAAVPPGDLAAARETAVLGAHIQAIAVAARAAAADALIASRRADPGTVAEARQAWFGGRPASSTTAARPRVAAVTSAAGLAARHASLRSVWFVSAARGAVALAAAVAVADLSGVQHGFWVALGTLSVLRTNAASTGSTVLRALAGTVAGFAVGAALLLAIGTGPAALWIALPVAICVAAYAPGTAPFAVGQAAFTITIVVLFNLLAPAGWRVGLLRIEDVAIGCAVSVVVGVFFWPRGASSVVGNDLSDAFLRGAQYLTQAVDWSLRTRRQPPEGASAAITASIRLDDALRGFLAEQGTKRLPKQELWSLVMAATRLRLTADSVAGLHEAGDRDGAGPQHQADRGVASLRGQTADLAGFYGRLSAMVGPPRHAQVPGRLTVPGIPADAAGPAGGDTGSPDADGAANSAVNGTADGQAGAGQGAAAQPSSGMLRMLWVSEHLRHLTEHAATITEPAEHLARLRRTPWWR